MGWPMLASLRGRVAAIPPDARRQLLNVAFFGLTLDGGINLVIFNLYLLRLNFGPEFIGLIGSIGLLVFALASLPAGRLGARHGLMRMMRIGAALCLAGAALALLAPSLPASAHSALFVLSTVVANLGIAAFYVNATPYLASVAGPAGRASVFSTQSAMFAVSGFAGSLIGGYLPLLFAGAFNEGTRSPEPYRLTLFATPLAMLCVLFVLMRMREPDAEQDEAPAAGDAGPAAIPRRRLAMPSRRGAIILIAIFAGIRFLQVGGIGAGTTFFNVFMDREFGVATSVIGNFQALAKLIGVPVALSIPWLTRRFGMARVAVLAGLATAVAMLPMAFPPTWWVAGLGYMAIWILTPVRYASFTVYSMERTPAALRSTMNGVQEMLAGLSFALISYSGGLMIGAVGYTPLFLLGGAMSLGGALALWLFDRRDMRDAAAHAGSV